MGRKSFKAYVIMDVFSRKVKGSGWRNVRSPSSRSQCSTTLIAEHGVPRLVHADSGASMKSNALKEFLTGHDVRMTHNRPYVSNDNPFSEAGFRTMKYRPHLPADLPRP